MVLKVSSQRQLTLSKALLGQLGNPRYLEAEVVDGALVLRPALKATLAEAELLYGRHGITQDVLMAALRIVERRKAKAAQDAEGAGQASGS